MKITKEQGEFLLDLLNETGFEIWNAGCTHRMGASHTDDGFKVCEYHNPLHPVKEFKTAQGAINFLTKKDEE